jgi:hypothetical protein
VSTREEWIAARRRLETQRGEIAELLAYLRGRLAHDLPVGTIAGVLELVTKAEHELVILNTAIADISQWLRAAAPGAEAPPAC